MWWNAKPYVSVGERRIKAQHELAKLQKSGRTPQPVQLEGTKIARTFWGMAWCDNLESYSDFASRLPRGRSYVRNGLVCDLKIDPGRITALVCGSELYEIEIAIKPLPPTLWGAIRCECAGQIGSVIELLQGRLSEGVMRIITRRESGLFPRPAEIELNCSCPDWAGMCKHVAAVLYGIGARLDEQPELLFLLRQVDHLELIKQAGNVKSLTKRSSGAKTIAADKLSDVFGIDIDAGPASTPATNAPRAGKPKKPSSTNKTNRRKKAKPSARGKKAGAEARPASSGRRARKSAP